MTFRDGTMRERATDSLPIAVIGAGPIGLSAAAHLLARGFTPLVLEAGSNAGSSIRAWSHVRFFSPWKYLVDPIAQRLLEEQGWTLPPGEELPTGGDFLRRYLEPLAALPSIRAHVRYGHRVLAISRLGYDKVRSAGREEAPFEIVTETEDGRQERFLAQAVIDASGTYATANPMGASGIPVEGEREQADRIHYGIPDIRDRQRSRYAGRRVLVVGSGHSAFNALLDLAWLKLDEPATEITWAIRRNHTGQLFGGGEKDALPARGSLGSRLRQLVDIGVIRMETGFRTTRVTAGDDGVLVTDGARVLGPVDEIIVATGARPDLDMLRELRLALDPALEAPVFLAPMIDPNVHSCGTVYPHGHRELRHPEPDFYVVGMKSYGRAPTFLLLTGYEQSRSVVAALAGDMAAADDVELVLPETGVCSTDGGAGCCTTGDARELVGAGTDCCTTGDARELVGAGTDCGTMGDARELVGAGAVDALA